MLAGARSVVDIRILELFVIILLGRGTSRSLPGALSGIVCATLLAYIALIHSVGKLGGRGDLLS